MSYLKAEDVVNYLEAIPRDKMFSVTFEKKDGVLRRMICRRDVRKHLKGGESTIKDHKNLISVYDTEAAGYRCFDVTRVKHIKGGAVEALTVKGFDGEAVNARGEDVKRSKLP